MLNCVPKYNYGCHGLHDTEYNIQIYITLCHNNNLHCCIFWKKIKDANTFKKSPLEIFYLALNSIPLTLLSHPGYGVST